jgi:hypothetical protein
MPRDLDRKPVDAVLGAIADPLTLRYWEKHGYGAEDLRAQK